MDSGAVCRGQGWVAEANKQHVLCAQCLAPLGTRAACSTAAAALLPDESLKPLIT